jgi:hypothetical protein
MIKKVLLVLGVSIVMGVPLYRWMVYMENLNLTCLFIAENPNLKWMRTEGPPISGNLHIANGPN